MKQEFTFEVLNKVTGRREFARFVLDIDTQELARRMARAAFSSKRGRATMAEGAIKLDIVK